MRYQKLDRFLNSSSLAASIFLASGIYKTCKDYNNASPKYKKRFLIKDSDVLTGSAIGMLANKSLSNKISHAPLYEKAVTKISTKINRRKYEVALRYTKDIVKELFSGFMSVASGVLGALGADYLLSKTKFKQPKYNTVNPPQQNKLSAYTQSRLDRFADADTRNAIYTSLTDMPAMKFVSSSMVGAQAIELAKDKEFDKRLKHTTEYLVNDTLIPLLFLSTSSALTKKLKPKYRIPIVFTSVAGGTLITNKALDKYFKKEYS